MWKPSRLMSPALQKQEKEPLEATKPPSSIPVKLLDRDYKMISRLGDGGFGVVRLAKYRHDKDNLLSMGMRGTLGESTGAVAAHSSPLVAIKTMNTRLSKLEHYTRVKEVQFIQAMPPHVNLLRVYEVFIDSSTYSLHFSMECMDQTLYTLMRSRAGRHLAPATVRSLLFQLLAAICHIHDHGYFHRDIKPQNILISSMLQYWGGRDAIPPCSRNDKYILKLADYGLARHVESCRDFTTYISTRWYRAPEMLLRRKWHLTPVDIWAFGAVAAEVANVSPLFPGANEIDQIWRVFRVLGSPAPPKTARVGAYPPGGYWAEGKTLALKCGYSFPEGSGIPFETLVSSAYPHLADMVRTCLRWNPETRPVASELRELLYFCRNEIQLAQTGLVSASSNVFVHKQAAKLANSGSMSPTDEYLYKLPPGLEADIENYDHVGTNKVNEACCGIVGASHACQSPRTAGSDFENVAISSFNHARIKDASSEGSFSFSGSGMSLTHLMS